MIGWKPWQIALWVFGWMIVGALIFGIGVAGGLGLLRCSH